MSDQFNRLAKHYSQYWDDKGIETPKMNFNIKAIEKEAEEKLKLEEDVKDNPADKSVEDKPKTPSKNKEFSVAGILAEDDDMVEKAIENKIKTLINRIADDKIRTALSDDLALFEKSMANKIQEIVNRLKPKVLSELKTVAPDVGSKSPKKDPENFTDVVMDEEVDVPFDKKSAVEVFPEIYVKANSEDESTGNIYLNKNGLIYKMAYVIDLPKTNSKKQYIKELQDNIENIIK